LKKVDAAHLGIDSHGDHDVLDNATNLVLLAEDATSRQFLEVETFPTRDSDCVWNIPLTFIEIFFGSESVSFFNETQLWLARLFLETKATKHACLVALAKIGRTRLQTNLTRLLRTYASDLRNQIRTGNESQISCAHTVSSLRIKDLLLEPSIHYLQMEDQSRNFQT
jgi:hypothetical protein